MSKLKKKGPRLNQFDKFDMIKTVKTHKILILQKLQQCFYSIND